MNLNIQKYHITKIPLLKSNKNNKNNKENKENLSK
jgi:hypothetical protein